MMAGPAPKIEWYIARDGAQHGPLSDEEMRKFLELRHLRQTDLVWCAGFPDWRPATEVFPELDPQHTEAAQQRAQAATGQSGGAPADDRGSIDVVDSGADRDFARANGDTRPAARDAAALHDEPATVSQTDRGAAGYAQAQPAPGRIGGGLGGVEPSLGGDGAGQQSSRQHGADHDWNTLRPDAGDSRHGRPGSSLRPGGKDDDFYDDDGYEPVRRNRFGRLAAVVAGVLIVGGASWVGWQNFAMLPSVSSLGNAVVATVAPQDRPEEKFQLPPFAFQGATRSEIDQALQKSAIWQVLKRDFKTWYDERVGDFERKRSQNEDEKVIAKFMADIIVVLRRNNAQAALQASTDRLRGIANAFLANLKQLKSRDAQTCFGFISYGEANPFMLELTKTPAFAETMQKQLVAVFSAVSDGKSTPKIYQAAQRADYDALTAELVRRGWSQEDLAVFSNPGRLSRAPPQKVCEMVQDWFAAQLALKDVEQQNRLLAESLKPLVFG